MLTFSHDDWEILAGICSFYLSERQSKYITHSENELISRILVWSEKNA